MSTATVHFSVLGEKGICGSGFSKHGVFTFTGEPAAITCERCKTLVANASVTTADCWAMEAEAYGTSKIKGPNPGMTHVRQLYTLAMKKGEVAVKRAQERLEYVQEQLDKTVQRARDAGAIESFEPTKVIPSWYVNWSCGSATGRTLVQGNDERGAREFFIGGFLRGETGFGPRSEDAVKVDSVERVP